MRKRVHAGLEMGVPNQSLYVQGQWYDGDTSPGLHLRVLVDNSPTGTAATTPLVSSGRQNNLRKMDHAIYTAVERMIGGWSHVQAIKIVKLDDNGGFGPFGFDVARETGELDENMIERKSCRKRPARRYPGMIQLGSPSKCRWG